MKRFLTGSLAAVLALGVLGCEPATKQDVEEIKAQQAEILAKLAAIEEGQKKGAAPARRGPPPEDYSKVHKINVTGAPAMGNPNAPITLIEYSDFQCPYCARTAPDVKAVLDKYPDKVRIVYKHFPLSFHQAAKPAAVASVAAQEQGKFWEFHDVIFEATASRTLAGSDEDMFKYAEKAGLDVPRFKADLVANRAEYEKRVNQDYVEGQRADVRGTPTLYLNGQKVQNRSVPGISAKIDEMIAQPGS
jgi:protein-disulfide isomerase